MSAQEFMLFDSSIYALLVVRQTCKRTSPNSGPSWCKERVGAYTALNALSGGFPLPKLTSIKRRSKSR